VKLMVMDGQGGGIGAAVIAGLRHSFGNKVIIYALGTNSIATARMMKAGANRGATGENAIVRTSGIADAIIGPISILMANSMLGEVTPQMTTAISSSAAKKVFIPLTQENVTLVGFSGEPLPHLVDKAVKEIEKYV